MATVTEHLLPILLLTILAPQCWAIDADCDYSSFLQQGQTYYVYNREYPQNYSSRASSCRWIARSDTRVELECQTFSLPTSTNCAGDRMSVSPSGDLQLRDAQNYCGTGTFKVVSTGNTLNIVLSTYQYSRGGRFLCTLKAVPAITTNCECGWKNQMRIVGGTETGTNEFPMMVGLVNIVQGNVFCGGTVIAKQYVLTAGHCCRSTSKANMGVLIGDHDISTGTDTAAAQVYKVESIVIHPLYDENTNYNDIAIIKISGELTFSGVIGPACLPWSYATASFDNQPVEALGWGTTEYSGPTSTKLQKVSLNIVPYGTCRQSYSTLQGTQICTSGNGKDTCQFDSGGPLLWLSQRSQQLFLIGSTSFGVACGSGVPSVNTRITSFLNWIVSVTPGAQYCHST